MIKKLYRIITSKIKYKLITAFSFLIMTPLLIIGLFSFKIAENIIIEKVRISTYETLENTAFNVDNFFQSMVYALNTISLNKSIRDILKNDNEWDGIKEWNEFKLIDNVFESINSTFFPYQGHFTLISKNKRIFTSWSREEESANIITSEQWYKDLKYNQLYWFSGFEKYMITNEATKRDKFFSVAQMICSNPGQVDGVCIVSVPTSEVMKLLFRSVSFPKSSLFILNEDNEIFFHTGEAGQIQLSNADLMTINNEPQGSYEIKAGKEAFLLNFKRLTYRQWKIVEAIPYDSMLDEINSLRSRILWLLVSFIIMFIAISWIMAVSITNPIVKLTESMKYVQDGDFSKRVVVNSSDEIGVLEGTFNEMVSRIQDLIVRLNEKQQKERELELAMLQAQINPHFLFNTLNSIRWVAIINQAENVGNMIGALVNLLKMSIYSKDKFITIEEEIENVKSYILIQKIRYSSNFETVFSIEQQIMQYKTLKLILQPIVENAILHGINRNSSDNVIKITGKQIGNDIEITVNDNGKGIDNSNLDIIKTRLKTNKESFSGIGIYNVHQRIVLNYGQEYGVDIISEEGKGTIVKIRFPAID